MARNPGFNAQYIQTIKTATATKITAYFKSIQDQAAVQQSLRSLVPENNTITILMPGAGQALGLLSLLTNIDEYFDRKPRYSIHLIDPATNEGIDDFDTYVRGEINASDIGRAGRVIIDTHITTLGAFARRYRAVIEKTDILFLEHPSTSFYKTNANGLRHEMARVFWQNIPDSKQVFVIGACYRANEVAFLEKMMEAAGTVKKIDSTYDSATVVMPKELKFNPALTCGEVFSSIVTRNTYNMREFSSHVARDDHTLHTLPMRLMVLVATIGIMSFSQDDDITLYDGLAIALMALINLIIYNFGDAFDPAVDGDTLRIAMVVALGIGTTAAAVCHESLGEMVSTLFHATEDASADVLEHGIAPLNP